MDSINIAILSKLASCLDREVCSLLVLSAFRSDLSLTGCPSCGGNLTRRCISAVSVGKTGRCWKCGCSLNRWTRTPLQGAKIKSEQLVALGACRYLGLSITRAARVVDVAPSTASYWYSEGERLGIFQAVFDGVKLVLK